MQKRIYEFQKRIYEFIVEQLKAVGADGLVNPRLGCGCPLDDLFPCDGPDYDCVLGRFAREDELTPEEKRWMKEENVPWIMRPLEFEEEEKNEDAI